jgi:catechol 2,3-dioxygenase-like lactoylglutathione lyase family enzyme
MNDSQVLPLNDVLIRSAVPTFLVSDVASTARWYSANLGFSVAGTVPPSEPHVYASIVRGPAEIMLLALEGYEKPDLRSLRPAGLWDAYFRADGVHAFYSSLEDQAFIQAPLTLRPYGNWEFEVRDPNGYVLAFGGDY